jgi:hypothetical protein
MRRLVTAGITGMLAYRRGGSRWGVFLWGLAGAFPSAAPLVAFYQGFTDAKAGRA